MHGDASDAPGAVSPAGMSGATLSQLIAYQIRSDVGVSGMLEAVAAVLVTLDLSPSVSTRPMHSNVAVLLQPFGSLARLIIRAALLIASYRIR